MREQRKLAAIMFTDIVGYTALMSRDEQHAHQLTEKSRDIIRKQLSAFNGELLDTVGDGTLSCFTSAVDAANCALEIQRSLKDETELRLRIGIHIGDVVFEGNGIYGDGVNVASRLEPLAEPGGICISGQVYRNIRNRPGMEAVFLGEKSLKNVDLPMKVYALTGEGLPAVTADSSVKKKAAKKLSRRIPIALVLLVTVILGLYTVYSRYFAEPTIASGVDDIKSIAVLPFLDMSAGKDQEYFCDGLAEELLNMLTKIKGLRVIARTSSFSFKGEKYDVRTIGKKLNVKMVLEGSVRKADHTVRITTQLINVADESHLWSETYDRKLDDIFAVQEDISRQVVDVLKVTLLGEEDEELSNRPTDNIEAYELFLQGSHNLNQWTAASFNKAVDYFTQATELDSNYAMAYAGLAFTYIFQYQFANLPRNEAISKAEEAALKALAVDDQLAEAYTAIGYIKDMQADLTAAEAAVRKAIEFNPNYMGAYVFYSDVLMDLGRWKDARVILEQGLEIDPLSWGIIRWLNLNLAQLGRLKESKYLDPDVLTMYGHLDVALWMRKREVERDPNNSSLHAILAIIYIDLGEYELAEKSLTRAKKLAPGKKEIGTDAEDYLYLAQGQYNQYLEFAYNEMSKDPERFISMAAFTEMLVCNYEKALALYERARSAYKRIDLPFGLSPRFIASHGRAELVNMANAYFKTSDPESGNKLLAESKAFLGKLREQGLGTPASYYFETSLNALGGDRQAALTSLRKAIDLGWRRSWFAKLDPPMESLWDVPEFKEMMAEVERELAWMRVEGKVYFYSILSFIGLLIAYLIFINRSGSRFACRYRRFVNISMGASMALGIIFWSVSEMSGLDNIIADIWISIILEYNVGWPVLGIIFGGVLEEIIALILTFMLLGVGVGMLAGFVRGLR